MTLGHFSYQIPLNHMPIIMGFKVYFQDGDIDRTDIMAKVGQEDCSNIHPFRTNRS